MFNNYQDFFGDFFYISFIFLLSKMSIGPNFILCTRNVIRYGYRVFFSNLAYVVSSFFWMMITMFTFAFFNKHIILKSSFAVFGSIYILKIAFSCIKKVKIDESLLHIDVKNIQPEKKTNFQIFLEGLGISISNPETMIFYSQILNLIEEYHRINYEIFAFYTFAFCLITFLWFNFLAILLNHVGGFLRKYQRYIMIIFALFLTKVAIKILYKNILILLNYID